MLSSQTMFVWNTVYMLFPNKPSLAQAPFSPNISHSWYNSYSTTSGSHWGSSNATNMLLPVAMVIVILTTISTEKS